jgi:hypothetical protein
VNYRDAGGRALTPERSNPDDSDNGSDADFGMVEVEKREAAMVEEEAGDKYSRIFGFRRRERTKFLRASDPPQCRPSELQSHSYCFLSVSKRRIH